MASVVFRASLAAALFTVLLMLSLLVASTLNSRYLCFLCFLTKQRPEERDDREDDEEEEDEEDEDDDEDDERGI